MRIGKKRMNKKWNEKGFTGLEAAIVLVAFVVVAAVFSYVMLGAGFFTTQKSQQVVETGVGQATSSLELDGQYILVNATGDTGSSGHAQDITFYITQTAGGTPVNLSKCMLTYIDSDEYIQIEYDKSASTHPWNYFEVVGDGDDLIEPNEKFRIIVDLTDSSFSSKPTTNEEVTIEIKPPVGAPLALKKTLPPSFENYTYV